MNDRPQPAPLTIAYIVGHFPSATEYFILNEIVELQKRDTRILIQALRRGSAPGTVTDGALSVNYPAPSLAAHAYLLRRRGGAYRRELRQAWAAGKASPVALLKALRDFSTAVAFLYALRGQQVHHLHAHFASLPARIGGLMARLSGLPFSCTAHAHDIYTTDRQELAGNLADARFVVTCTAYNKSYLEQVLTAQSPACIHHIYHGLELSRWPWQERQFAWAGKAVHVLTVGRLVEKKGTIYLLQAVRQLREQGTPVCLTVVGEGPYRGELEAYIRQHQLGEAVRLRGALPQEEVKALYQAADLFVLPCLVAADGDRDGLPNVLLEALAVGLPVVSTPVSAVPELIHHRETGLLIPPKSPEDIAAALRLLISDPQLCRHLSRAGRRKLEREFCIGVSTDRLAALFQAGQVGMKRATTKSDRDENAH